MNEFSSKIGANIWVHDLSPFLVRFSDSLGLSWYGLAYFSAFLVGGLLLFTLTRREQSIIQPQQIPGYLTAVVFGTLIGGRLGYALLYSPNLLWETTTSPPYWRLLKVWEGGLASHGGILGLALGTLLYSRRHRLKWRSLIDLATLGGSVGIFFGRIANFINGELFGRKASPELTWAVKFPQEILAWPNHDLRPGLGLPLEQAVLPRLTPAVTELGTLAPEKWQQWLSELPRLPREPSYIAQGLEAGFLKVIREIIAAVQEGNQAVIDALSPQLTPRYPSQLIEAGLEGLMVLLAVVVFWRKPRKPGVIASFWLITYSIARIVAEQFRLPDAQIGFQLWDLTRGQWLSISTLVIGCGFYYFFQKQSTAAVTPFRHPLKYQNDSSS